MDKLIQRIYTDYKSKLDLENRTHSVHYEMATALLNKRLKEVLANLEIAKQINHPVMKYGLEAESQALITLITELTAITMELFLQEPAVEYESEEDIAD